MSGQDKKEIELKLAKQEESIAHTEHVLKVLTSTPKGSKVWDRPEMQNIRELVEVIRSNPQIYHLRVGDHLPDGSIVDQDEDAKIPAPTTNYVKMTAAGESVIEYAPTPVLQVVSKNMALEGSTGGNNHTNMIHFTNLRVCDGSGDVMLARLSMQIAHDGDKLKEGDIIQLNLFTPLTYPPSGGGGSHHRMPAVVVHTYTKIGYSALPKELNPPMHCITMTQDEVDECVRNESQNLRGGEGGNDDEDDQYERLVEVECTAQNRCCSLYGVSQVVCVCESDPVDKIDLEMVRRYCHFATTDVSKMKNGWKRNMLYWWYMTNIYNICGKDNRKEPPACLKAAIRKKFPEPNGLYKRYVPKKKSRN